MVAAVVMVILALVLMVIIITVSPCPVCIQLGDEEAATGTDGAAGVGSDALTSMIPVTNTNTKPEKEQEEEEGVDFDDDDDGEYITKHYIQGDIIDQLTALGFSENAVKKACVAGCVDVKTCQQWIELQLDHPELNTPLDPSIKVVIKRRRVLTEAEREAKVAELKQKIAKKKIQDELTAKQNEYAAERATRQAAKEAREARELHAERARKQAYEEMKKEKERDRLAKAKIELDIAVDKLVRQGKTHDEAVVIATKKRDEKTAKLLEMKRQRAQEEEEARKRAPSAGADNNNRGGGGEWSFLTKYQQMHSWGGAEGHTTTHTEATSATNASPKVHTPATTRSIQLKQSATLKELFEAEKLLTVDDVCTASTISVEDNFKRLLALQKTSLCELNCLLPTVESSGSGNHSQTVNEEVDATLSCAAKADLKSNCGFPIRAQIP